MGAWALKGTNTVILSSEIMWEGAYRSMGAKRDKYRN